MITPSPTANAQDVTGPTLFREIDALGGVADGSPYDLGYSTALNLVLAILERRGFSEFADATAMQHVAYYDEGQFEWMSGIRARDCELYTPVPA